MGEDSKPVGRPAKKDLAYVKLDYFNEGTDAGEWIARAEECVDLLGHKGEDAAGYILYHIRGGAKLELSMLGNKLLNKEHIFNSLRERCSSRRSRGERLHDLVDRKQREGENITMFIDAILKLGLSLKEDIDGWEGLMTDSFKTNVFDCELRRYLLISGKKKSFSEIRSMAREFESMSNVKEGGICYKIETNKVIGEVTNRGNDGSRLEERIQILERRNTELEGRLRGNWTDRVRCFTCGGEGHTSKWCRNRNLNRQPFQ